MIFPFGCTPVAMYASIIAFTMALVCIIVIFGSRIPTRTPRKPIIGFFSLLASHISLKASADSKEHFFAKSAANFSSFNSSSVGKNSCKGGSNKRMVTGKLPACSNKAWKSSLSIGPIFLSKISTLDASSLAKIIDREMETRSALAKSMCSVRHNPMPCAPKYMASFNSAAVSAFAYTPKLFASSTQLMNLDIFGCCSYTPSPAAFISTFLLMTNPSPPSSEIQSPDFTVAIKFAGEMLSLL